MGGIGQRCAWKGAETGREECMGKWVVKRVTKRGWEGTTAKSRNVKIRVQGIGYGKKPRWDERGAWRDGWLMRISVEKRVEWTIGQRTERKHDGRGRQGRLWMGIGKRRAK